MTDVFVVEPPWPREIDQLEVRTHRADPALTARAAATAEVAARACQDAADHLMQQWQRQGWSGRAADEAGDTIGRIAVDLRRTGDALGDAAVALARLVPHLEATRVLASRHRRQAQEVYDRLRAARPPMGSAGPAATAGWPVAVDSATHELDGLCRQSRRAADELDQLAAAAAGALRAATAALPAVIREHSSVPVVGALVDAVHDVGDEAGAFIRDHAEVIGAIDRALDVVSLALSVVAVTAVIFPPAAAVAGGAALAVGVASTVTKGTLAAAGARRADGTLYADGRDVAATALLTGLALVPGVRGASGTAAAGGAVASADAAATGVPGVLRGGLGNAAAEAAGNLSAARHAALHPVVGAREFHAALLSGPRIPGTYGELGWQLYSWSVDTASVTLGMIDPADQPAQAGCR